MSDKVYDLGQLNELAAGSEEFVQSMIDTFLEHTPQQLEEILQAYRDGDLQRMGGVAHKIKPNIDLFQINGITSDIRLVEDKGKSGVSDSELSLSLGKVELVLKESFKQLREL